MKFLVLLPILFFTKSLLAKEVSCQVEVDGKGDAKTVIAEKVMEPNDIGIDTLQATHKGFNVLVFVNTQPADGSKAFIRSELGTESIYGWRSVSSSSVYESSYNTRLEHYQPVENRDYDWTGYFYFSCQIND